MVDPVRPCGAIVVSRFAEQKVVGSSLGKSSIFIWTRQFLISFSLELFLFLFRDRKRTSQVVEFM